MKADERRMKVLQAIVEDYVKTREPVGSRAVTERHHLDVSPATIRNDMATLEEYGYIHQPHTSAGRVPTEQGYRAFVDTISQLKPLTPPQRRAIETLLEGAADVDDVLMRAGKLLAHLTNNVAVVQYPSRQRGGGLRHIEIIPVADGVLLVIVITESGLVQQRRVDAGSEVSLDQALAMSSLFNATCAGLDGAELAKSLLSAVATVPGDDREFAATIAAVVREATAPVVEERFVTAGTANLARTNQDFSHSISPVLDALEEQVVLLRLFAEIEDELAITIGSENKDKNLSEASVVTSTYAGGSRLGILGPTRMDYPGAMVAVRAVASYVSKLI